MSANGLIKFGDYEIDRARWLLRWRDESLSLNRKTFDLLLYLADHSDRVVGKEELLRELWPASFVDESNLTQHIFLLRKALSRHESGKKIIETVPGRGYRFAAPIEEQLAEPNRVAMSASDSMTRIILEEEVESTEPALPAPLAGSAPSYPAVLAFLLGSVPIVAAFFLVLLLMRPPRLRIVNATRLTNDGIPKQVVASANAIVADGSHIMFTERRDNRSLFAEAPIEGGEVHSRLAPLADAILTDYSSVNHTLLIGSAWRTDDDRPILAEALPGAKFIQVGELTGHEATWSPDAHAIAVVKGRFLYVADADGSNERRLVTAAGVVYAPRWSPDGRTIRFSENLGGDEDQLWEVDATGADLHRLLTDDPHGGRVCCGSWSVDGRNFFYIVQGMVTNSIWVVPRRPSIFGRQQPIQLTVGLSDLWQTPLPSPDGRSLWAIGSHRRGELTIVDPVTRGLQTFLGGLSAEGVSFSPDRSWIVYTDYPEGTLWRSHPDGSEKQQLTKSPMVARFPQWSPDGRTIAYMGSLSGATWRIYLLPATGGKSQPMFMEDASQGVPSWSPDGRQIAFGRLLDFGNERDPNLTIEFYDLDRRSHKTLHGSQGLWTARWSPDGRFLTAVTQDNQNLRLYDMQTQQWTDLANLGVNDVIWSRDSRYIYFDTLFGGDPALYRIAMDTRKIERWADLRGFPRAGFYDPWVGMTPDGSPMLLKDTSIEEVYRLDLESSN